MGAIVKLAHFIRFVGASTIRLLFLGFRSLIRFETSTSDVSNRWKEGPTHSACIVFTLSEIFEARFFQHLQSNC